jgi:hypothetical protein
MDVFVGQHDPGSSPGHRQPHCQHHVAHGLKIKSHAISGGEGVVSEAHGQGLEKGCDEGGRAQGAEHVAMRAMASARGRVWGRLSLPAGAPDASADSIEAWHHWIRHDTPHRARSPMPRRCYTVIVHATNRGGKTAP